MSLVFAGAHLASHTADISGLFHESTVAGA